MYTSNRDRFLKRVLLLDAITCFAMCVLLIFGATFIASLALIPTKLSIIAGILLLPIAGFMAFVATRKPVPPGGVMLVVLGNLAWVIGSLVLIAGPWIEPNVIGQVLIGGQALGVLGLAILEYVGLGRRQAVPAV